MFVEPVEASDETEAAEGFYHSIATLEKALGSLFVATPIIDERFIMIHYGFDEEENADERALLKALLTAKGLVNMRLDTTLTEIDFTSFNGNEFGIFSAREIKSVPSVKSDEDFL